LAISSIRAAAVVLPDAREALGASATVKDAAEAAGRPPASHRPIFCAWKNLLQAPAVGDVDRRTCSTTPSRP
jgi:hypothetical protein